MVSRVTQLKHNFTQEYLMTNEKIKIEDNFLHHKDFTEIQNFMMSKDCSLNKLPWFYNHLLEYVDESMGEESDQFHFFHLFYLAGTPQSPYMNDFTPILQKIDPLSIWRIKANLFTRTANVIEFDFHTDLPDLANTPEKMKQWTTSIFYMNTNDGYTRFEDGTKVESVANRYVSFPSNLKHSGTTCSNEKTRVTINFNYFDKI
jgi:hypothetical protein